MDAPSHIDMAMLPDVCNKAFLPLLLNKDRWLIIYGGAGSGKSYFVVEKILARILKAISRGKKHKFLCLRKTVPAAKKSVFPLFKEYIDNWGLRSICKINQTDMTITFAGGSEILITGLDDPEKVKSIQGVTGVWIEEATEFTYDDFMQLDLRLRGETWDYKQIIMSFNPIDEGHWIRKKLFTDSIQSEIESGVRIVQRTFTMVVEGKEISYSMSVMHSTYRDNRFIDDVYKARLEGLVEQDQNYYNIYCCGRWGVLKGLIFDKWETVREWPEASEFDTAGFGLDFGYSVDPTAIVEAGFIGRSLYVREHCYEKELNNRDIAARLLKLTHGLSVPVVADSAEPKSIDEIRGYNQPCLASIKGPDSISNGIQRIKQFNLMVDYGSSNMIKELQSYKWAEDKNGQLLNKPVDFQNHLIDALRYIVTRIKGFANVDLEILSPDDKQKKKPDYLINDVDVVDTEAPGIWDEL